MTKSKYKYIVIKEEKVIRITELSGPLPRKDAQEMLAVIKKLAKHHGPLV